MIQKLHWPSILLETTFAATAITGWQKELDWFLRCLASAVAVTVGLIALYQRIKRHQKLPLD